MVQCAKGWYRDPNNINQCCRCMVCPVGDDNEGAVVDECRAYVDSERRRGVPDVEFRFCHSPTGNCEMQPRLTTTTQPVVKKTTASTTMTTATTVSGSTKNTVISLDTSTSDEVPMLMLIIAVAIIVVLGLSLLLVCRRRKLLCRRQKPSPQLPGAKSTVAQSNGNLPEAVAGQLEYIDESSSAIPAVSTRSDMLPSDCKVTSENFSAAVTETTYLKNSSAGGLSSRSNFESSNQAEQLGQQQEGVTSSETKRDGDDDQKSSIVYFHRHEELENNQQPDGEQRSRRCEEERRLLEKRSDDEETVENKPQASSNYEEATCSYKNQAAPTISVKSSSAVCHTEKQHESSNSDNRCKLEMSNFNALYIRGTRDGFLIQQATNPPPPPPSAHQQPSFNSTSAATRQQEEILFASTTEASEKKDVDSTPAPVESAQDDGNDEEEEEEEVLKSTIPLLVDGSRYDDAGGSGMGGCDRRLKFDMLKKSSLVKDREAEMTNVTVASEE